MSNTRLSCILSTLASTQPPETFHFLLARGVYPVLDALPAFIRYKVEGNLAVLQLANREVLQSKGYEAQMNVERNNHCDESKEQGDTLKLESIAAFEKKPTVLNYQEVVRHSPSNAQIYLEKGLGAALLALQEEIDQVYPDVEKALIHLEGQFEALHLPRRLHPDAEATGTEYKIHQKRNEVLSRLVQLAQHYHTEGTTPRLRVRIKNEHRDVSTAEEIRGWAAVLDDWPNEMEAEKIRLSLGLRTSDTFYAIDGVARILAERCTCSTVAESITAAYEEFGPKGYPITWD